jgi:hypothetical protein
MSRSLARLHQAGGFASYGDVTANSRDFAFVVILIIRLPTWPSRLKATSMPMVLEERLAATQPAGKGALPD